MTSLSFLSRFFRLASLNILSNLMVPLAGLIDVSFLGHLSDIRYLAGVALATVLFNYIYWTFGFLRMSTTGLTAQAMGRGEEASAWLIGLRHGLMALGLGGLILLLQWPLQQIGFLLLSADATVEAAGQAYYNALIWGAPANLIGFVLIGWFLGREQSLNVLILSAIGNGANVVLDYEFIVRWGWGSAGAGAATAISQYLLLLVGIGLVGREIRRSGGALVRQTTADDTGDRPSFKDQSSFRDQPALSDRSRWHSLWEQVLDRAALRQVFLLNREIVIRTFALITTFALFTNLSATFGTGILAANTVLLQVVTLAAYFIDGLAFATESLTGLLHGQGDTPKLQRLVRVAASMSLMTGIVFAIVFLLFPIPLFGLLTDHRDILDRLPTYVPWLIPVLGFGSIAYLLDGYFLGLTQGKILRQSSVQAALIGFMPLAIVAWAVQSNHLLWGALALFMMARGVTLGQRVPATLAVQSANRFTD